MPGRIPSHDHSVENSEAHQLPTLPVPASLPPLVCVEHPCIIKNLDRGISSLGGEYAINKLFEHGKNPTSFEVSLRPEDPMAKTHSSQKVDVRQLVLKLTVPKRTGRKRKLGSNDPFEFEQSDTSEAGSGATKSQRTPSEAETLLQSFRDNKGRSSVEVFGKIDETHRFRSLPEYQYATSTNSLMQTMRSSIMTSDLAAIRDFKYDVSRTLPPGQDVGPPPFFNLVQQPFNYSYRQNPYTKVVHDAEGNIHITNTTAAVKHIRHNLHPDAPQVPTEPPGELPELEKTTSRIQAAVRELRALFKERPLMQRRVYINRFKGKQTESELKAAVGYCGYAFTSGPWRDTVIKLGVDPRKDPQLRIYQTVSYQLHAHEKGADDDPGSTLYRSGGKRVTKKVAKLEHSHIFDGNKFYKDGKVWQACDVTDPLLSSVLENVPLLSEPDMFFSGWYGNGTWSVFRHLMKYKIQTVASGKQPNEDMCKAIIAMFPPFVDETNVHLTRADEPGSFISQSDQADYNVESEAAFIASEIRATAMAAWRYRNKQHEGKTRSIHEQGADIDMPDRDAQRNRTGPAATPGQESDAALIGLDSESEGDQEESEVEGLDPDVEANDD